ncbi:hypothetical protein PILCRDRAFT_406073 [Piloderma croceum F 1598]|uniref:Uncharacterized protein n=1 Tax=Piloderma croceum (strain F 1598) TaxID=765440 RepID=A0A0C3BD84_PILCF|nr:hypothetical protein PILCRDRAFT_406073 [Piloderma croceum F 1598]
MELSSSLPQERQRNIWSDYGRLGFPRFEGNGVLKSPTCGGCALCVPQTDKIERGPNHYSSLLVNAMVLYGDRPSPS